MSAQITKIPNRNELVQKHEDQARLYLREFDAKKYPTYYARIFDAEAYLNQIGVEKICELIEHGNCMMHIAKKLDISTRTLRAWIGRDTWRRTQVAESYTFAGEAFAFKAEEALRSAWGGSKEEIALAAKLADHYRWMASRLDREKFGETVKQDANTGKAPMNITLNFGGAEAPKEQLVKAAPIVADFLRLQDE